MTDIPRSLLDAAYELVRTSKNECGPTPEDIARFALARDKRAAGIAYAIQRHETHQFQRPENRKAEMAREIGDAVLTYLEERKGNDLVRDVAAVDIRTGKPPEPRDDDHCPCGRLWPLCRCQGAR
jgi:hypothetical protein